MPAATAPGKSRNERESGFASHGIRDLIGASPPVTIRPAGYDTPECRGAQNAARYGEIQEIIFGFSQREKFILAIGGIGGPNQRFMGQAKLCARGIPWVRHEPEQALV